MIKTKDGYEVNVGMWVSDMTGTYEVKSIDNDYVHLEEILWDDDWSDRFHYGIRVRLTHKEMKTMEYC